MSLRKLLKETSEVRSWIYDIRDEEEMQLTTVEGFSVKKNKVTTFFERLKSLVDKPSKASFQQ
jgi:hypothetical protein